MMLCTGELSELPAQTPAHQIRRVTVRPRLADGVAVLERLARAGLHAPGPADSERAAAIGDAELARVREDAGDLIRVLRLDDLFFLDLHAMVFGVPGRAPCRPAA